MSPDLVENCRLARAVLIANPEAPFAPELRAAMNDGLHVAMADPSTVFSSAPPADVIVVAFDTESGGPGSFDSSFANIVRNSNFIVLNAGRIEQQPYETLVAGAKSHGYALAIETTPDKTKEWSDWLGARLHRGAGLFVFAPPLN